MATAANAHGGAIHVVCEGPGGALLSCGKDGEIRMWSAALEPVRSHALLTAVAQALPLLTPRADGRPPRLRALDWDDPTGALLVGTAGSELLVVDTTAPTKSRLLGTGHAPPPKRGTMGAVAGGGGGGAVEEADEELGAVRALATAAWLDVAATGGDDAALRLWSVGGRRALLTSSLGAPISALDFARADAKTLAAAAAAVEAAASAALADPAADPAGDPAAEDSAEDFDFVSEPAAAGGGDATLLGVGFGAAPFGWAVLRVAAAGGAATATATEVVRRDGRARVTALRFAPGGAWLAVGSADAQIALVDAAAGWVEVARCAGHSSAITQLDWTDDGYVLRSNCLGHELRFWDVDPDELRASATGEQITLASACRDLRWASFGVTLGWHCQGIYASAADGTGVHGVDRSDDGALLATADAYGQVNLLRYPCVARPPRGGPPNRRSFGAHASAALGCRWVGGGIGGDRLVSIGGLDLCVLQWRRVPAMAV